MKRILIELMPPILKKLIKILLINFNILNPPAPVIPIFIDKSIGTYSQHQEDLVLDALLQFKQQGFYVDIGANHPEILSNTKRFYERGWSGINVEPILENYLLFSDERKRDINLNVGVGAKKGELDFYKVDKEKGVYSGFDKKHVLRYAKEEEIVIRKVPIKKLNDIFTEYIKDDVLIDFMSVDVEGFEIEVLSGNDWSKYRPYLIMIEFGNKGKEIINFLKDTGYTYIFSNGKNGIFRDSKGLAKVG